MVSQHTFCPQLVHVRILLQFFATQGLLAGESGSSQSHGLLKQEIEYLQQYSFDYTEKGKADLEAKSWSAIVGDKEACCICLNQYVDKEKKV